MNQISLSKFLRNISDQLLFNKLSEQKAKEKILLFLEEELLILSSAEKEEFYEDAHMVHERMR